MGPLRGGGHDWINTCLPDELIVDIFRRLLDSKPSHDSCSLVCKRWLALERLSRTTLRIGATGSPDLFVNPPLPQLRQRPQRLHRRAPQHFSPCSARETGEEARDFA
ncbi:hypothetical protein M0R45_020724 [Rubus argutus]|uniref:F-box domain-containing protein n=1 Tax=Rubus argutus TaxID=59490 RepID=A0AAW1XAI0_RUBAR